MIHRRFAPILAPVDIGQRDVHMSPGQRLLKLLADRILQKVHGTRHFHGQIQKTVIDAF
jgi:hypothetical protein